MNTESPDFIRHFGKDSIKSFAEYEISRIEEGIDNPLEFKIKATALKKSLEIIEDKIKNKAFDEASKYRGEGKVVEVFGAKIEFSDLGVRWDYSDCGDTQWNEFDKKIKELSELKKERELFLKSIKGTLTIADETTGEMITIQSPIRSGKEGIKISF